MIKINYEIKLYADQNYTLYQLCKDKKIPKGLLYQYANRSKSIDNMSIKIFKKIADYSKMTMDELYEKINLYQNTFILHHLSHSIGQTNIKGVTHQEHLLIHKKEL